MIVRKETIYHIIRREMSIQIKREELTMVICENMIFKSGVQTLNARKCQVDSIM
jgi:hypothetical protein